jgi:rhodanese-related sulfurtransferase
MLNKGFILLLAWILLFPAACAIAPVSRPDGSVDSAGGPGEAGDKNPRVAPEELKSLLDGDADIIVVDTMSPSWYRKGHIIGAINLPWRESLGEPVGLPRTKLLVIYCDCPNEETSADVAEQLTGKLNYENVKVLVGGWSQWVKLGYPTEKGEPKALRKASLD